jgi:hypothetical protein
VCQTTQIERSHHGLISIINLLKSSLSRLLEHRSDLKVGAALADDKASSMQEPLSHQPDDVPILATCPTSVA